MDESGGKISLLVGSGRYTWENVTLKNNAYTI